MCQNGNNMQLNMQERGPVMNERIETQPDELQNSQMLNSQLQDSQMQSSQLQSSYVQNDLLLKSQQNIPQVSPFHEHVAGLKKDQELLKQAHEEYSPYNVQDQVAKYIHPRLEENKRWDKKGVHYVKKLNFDAMAQAYSMTGFKLADSMEKKYKMLKAAEKRYDLQHKFEQKISRPERRNLNISMKDAMKMSDEKLVENYGINCSGPAAEYINVRYSLMKNPFYSIMPIDELKKTPRHELLEKLDKEYSRNDARRGTIVALYEDLIRLQILEKQANAAKTKPGKDHPEAITQKEIKDNTSYRKKIDSEIDGYKHLSDGEKKARKDAVKSVMTTGALWEDRELSDLDGLSAAQREGVRMILAWMYKNCGAGKEASKEAFVYTLTQAKPKQLLFMLYLVENGMSAAPESECFYDALKNYIPDPKARAFKKKPNWTAISQASVFVRNCEEFNVFLESEKEEKALKETVKNYAEPEEGRENADRTEALGRLAEAQIRKIVAMYNAAGLAPDMPADLISDPTLKQHVLDTVGEFKNVFDQMQVINKGRLGGKDAGPDLPGQDTDSELKTEETGKISKKDADEKISYIKGGLDIPKSYIKILGSDVAKFSANLPYAVATGGLSALFGLYGFFSKGYELIKLNTLGLSGAEIASKTLDLTGGVIKGGADVVKGAADIYKTASEFDMSKYTNLGDLIKTNPGALQFGAGAMSLLAGGLQAGSGIIDLKRTSDSQKHLNQAKEHLANKKALDKQEDDNRLKELTEDQKKQRVLQRKEIESLIKHRTDMTKNKKNSATIKMVGGILTMAGGALTMTGLLAPIGGLLSIAGSAISIGLGIIGARIDRNKAICDAVDEGLKLPAAVRKVVRHFGLKNLSSDEQIQLIDRVRQEALAELNYSDYKACYFDMCKKSTTLLYNKVMIKPTENREYIKTEEYKMYYETLMSLGFKEIKRAKYPFQTNHPTPKMIYDRLTQGVA